MSVSRSTGSQSPTNDLAESADSVQGDILSHRYPMTHILLVAFALGFHPRALPCFIIYKIHAPEAEQIYLQE